MANKFKQTAGAQKIHSAVATVRKIIYRSIYEQVTQNISTKIYRDTYNELYDATNNILITFRFKLFK